MSCNYYVCMYMYMYVRVCVCVRACVHGYYISLITL